MRQTPSWWYGERGLVSSLLSPIATIYGNMAAKKSAGVTPYVSRLPVICVGNYTAGGGGKTPTAIAIADVLKIAGETPAFLTRGYGGKAEGPTIVTTDMDAADVGDEPLLLAEHAPTVVSADREKGAQVIETLEASVIIMDDGFQNPSLHKDLAVIAIDARAGIGNGMLIPAGPLRAPLEEQIAKTDALVVVGEGTKADKVAAQMIAAGKPVLKARIEPTQDTRWLSVLPVIAFAGIARPEKFFATLGQAGGRIEGKQVFPDHHRYTAKEAQALLDQAQEKSCMLVTTQKDWVRLPDDRETPQGELKFRSRPLAIAIRIGDEAALGDLVMAAVKTKRGA
ncbi:tetraacyldisaccharide 4'-kinase [Methyloligella sp. 2.7D]|uniref:tetraacyldisaccharide 4'-kinase n=1 Tax=unclassified Methyloligella TaxID=2625955 RepID=UPI00157E028B|nr:tetraacyldisaccharide 4'-kinase [Methyloligella sp. GL2]QKP78342.1 tetraacyldisaccharide 4'-kinase [Methyloligella sp. GL2]